MPMASRGKMTDRNREDSIQKHPVLNQRASFLKAKFILSNFRLTCKFQLQNKVVGLIAKNALCYHIDKVVRKKRLLFAVLN